jgi:three-Cys-motif partner protein
METHQFGGPWTVENLDALRAYLIGYAQALKNQPFRRYYIDAFAGTGDRAVKRQEAASLMEIPELDVMTKGSARVASKSSHHSTGTSSSKSGDGGRVRWSTSNLSPPTAPSRS